jgi:hypothetical protein
MKLIRKLLPALALAAIALPATPLPALADLPGAYEVESKTTYCSNHKTDCVAKQDWSKLRFADVLVTRFTPGRTCEQGQDENQQGQNDGQRGQHEGGDAGNGNCRPDTDMDEMSGKPDVVHLVCATHYLNQQDQTVHARTIDVTAGGPFGGTAGGNADLVEAAEGMPNARTHLDVFARNTAPNGQPAFGFAHGTQWTNNASDTRNRGGYEVSVTGPIADINPATGGPDGPPPLIVGYGTMHCSTNVTPVPLRFASPPYFEGEVYDSPDPAS